MTTGSFDDLDTEEEFQETATIVPEASPSTKLERRRKIEDLFEEKRLKEELEDYSFF